MAGDFLAALNQFAGKTDKRVNLVIKKIIFDIGTELVLKSPVGDAKFWKSPAPEGYVGGRFRGNWQYAIDAIDKTTTEKTDASGQVTIGAMGAAIPEETVGKVHYITNSLPYAMRIEEGHSHRQAPNGVVGITALEFQPIVRAAAAELT